MYNFVLAFNTFCNATKVITQFNFLKEISLNALLSRFLCIFAPIVSASSQLAPSYSFDELNPDWGDLRLELVSTNELKVSNHWIIFTRSIKSLLFLSYPVQHVAPLSYVLIEKVLSLLHELQHICVLRKSTINVLTR